MLPMIKSNNFFPSVLDEFFSDTPIFRTSENRFLPKVNIAESEKAYLIEFSAPGLNKEDFKIEVKDNVLTISTEKKEDQKEDGKSYTRREFIQTCFSRSFILPESVDSSKIEASYKNGILYLPIPKKEEKEQLSRVINIQ